VGAFFYIIALFFQGRMCVCGQRKEGTV